MTDLREFIDAVQHLNELRVIEGADWDLEIGTMVELNYEKRGPALLFDKIKGYPPGYRILGSPMNTVARSLAALGFPTDLDLQSALDRLDETLAEYRPIPPVEVTTGPILQNTFWGDEVDLWKFPTPHWHEADGGRYLGTGCIVIMRDPETGQINLGTYRGMIHDKNTMGLQIASFHEGSTIERKYWKQGKACPVAIGFGQDPLLFLAASGQIKVGLRNEYELVGHFRGGPVEVIPEEVTGLPIPATAEIIIAGEIPPPSEESRLEGPFGEFTGYYTPARQEQVVRVKALYHRDDPIILGEPPLRQIGEDSEFWALPVVSRQDMRRLKRAGIEGIVDVWRAASPGVVVVQVRQQYAGHAMKAALALSGGYMNRFVVVVDEDVNPRDPADLLWAIGTRCDPETALTVMKGMQGHRLDPRLDPRKKDRGDLTCSCAVINACKPYDWIDEFPKANVASPELRRAVREKWKDLF